MSPRSKVSSSPLVLLAILLGVSQIAKSHDNSDMLTASSSSSYSPVNGGGACPQGMVSRIKYDMKCASHMEMVGSSQQDHPETGPPNCKVSPVSTCVARSTFSGQQQQQMTTTPYAQQQQPQPQQQQQNPVVYGQEHPVNVVHQQAAHDGYEFSVL